MARKGFVQVQGTQLVVDGRPLVFRGFGIGNWLNLEHFMIGLPGTESQLRAAIEAAYGAGRASQFWQRYQTCYVTDADFKFMASIGVNTVRIPINYRHIEGDQQPYTYREATLREIDRVLELCARNRIFAVLDLHTAPGGQSPDWHCDNAIGEALFWEYAEFRERMIKLWRHLATRYRDNPWVAGYDLLNEPVLRGNDMSMLVDWHNHAIATIREVDKDHVCFIEGNLYAHEFTMYKPHPDQNIAYSFHHYPFFSLDTYLNENSVSQLENAMFEGLSLNYVRDTLQRPLWCGETGIPRTKGRLPEHEAVHMDTISLMEKHGFSWSIWCYKDARSMGAVMPKEDSPWMNFSRRASNGWHFWNEFDDNARIDELEKQHGKPLDETLRRRLKFRQLADNQYLLTDRYADLLASIPFDELITYPESFLFERCETWPALVESVRSSAQR